jgi:hypothetical protein
MVAAEFAERSAQPLTIAAVAGGVPGCRELNPPAKSGTLLRRPGGGAGARTSTAQPRKWSERREYPKSRPYFPNFIPNRPY